MSENLKIFETEFPTYSEWLQEVASIPGDKIKLENEEASTAYFISKIAFGGLRRSSREDDYSGLRLRAGSVLATTVMLSGEKKSTIYGIAANVGWMARSGFPDAGLIGKEIACGILDLGGELELPEGVRSYLSMVSGRENYEPSKAAGLVRRWMQEGENIPFTQWTRKTNGMIS